MAIPDWDGPEISDDAGELDDVVASESESLEAPSRERDDDTDKGEAPARRRRRRRGRGGRREGTERTGDRPARSRGPEMPRSKDDEPEADVEFIDAELPEISDDDPIEDEQFERDDVVGADGPDDDAGEDSHRPRPRRRRRRRGSAPQARPQAAPERESEEAGPAPVDDFADDEMDASDYLDEDDDGSGETHRKIPTWGEAIGAIVDANMEARHRDPGGGRGRGRGGRRN